MQVKEIKALLRSLEFESHLSLTSPEVVKDQVSVARRDGDSEGLRVAELIIHERGRNLSDFLYTYRQKEIELEKIVSKIRFFDTLDRLSFGKISYFRWRKELLRNEIEKVEEDIVFTRPLVRDTCLEIAAAIAAREEILSNLKRPQKPELPGCKNGEALNGRVDSPTNLQLPSWANIPFVHSQVAPDCPENTLMKIFEADDAHAGTQK